MVLKYTFQHYIDISTSASSVTMLKIRAGGEYALQRCKHLIGAYKYCKLGNISIKLIPASTLPVDPLGLSYASDDPQTVDPRDQLNPGLVRITNGEDIFENLNSLSDTQLEQMYTNTMLDPRWSKFMLQSGFKRHAVPLYYNVGMLEQDAYPGTVTNLPGIASGSGAVSTTTARFEFDGGPVNDDTYNGSTNYAKWDRLDSSPRGLFQTGKKGRLGWMPTDSYAGYVNDAGVSFNYPMLMPILCPEVMVCILPKAHKTLYYYRMFITETIYFSGLKNYGIAAADNNEYRAFDNFTSVVVPTPKPPSEAVADTGIHPNPWNDGSTEHFGS